MGTELQYLEVSAVTQAAADSHGDRSNAWSRCLRTRRGAEPGLQGREPFSWDTAGSKHLLDEGHPINQRRKIAWWIYSYRGMSDIFIQSCCSIQGVATVNYFACLVRYRFLCPMPHLTEPQHLYVLGNRNPEDDTTSNILSGNAMQYTEMVRTYHWDCDSEVDHDTRFKAGAEWVAANQIHWCWRRHVELALCSFGHQEEWDFNWARQPWQIIYLRKKRKKCQRLKDVYCGLYKMAHVLPMTNDCNTFPLVKVLQTSTSGVSCTFWSSLVTVWTNKSICCFFRSLKATSFRSSSIWQRRQITDIHAFIHSFIRL